MLPYFCQNKNQYRVYRIEYRERKVPEKKKIRKTKVINILFSFLLPRKSLH